MFDRMSEQDLDSLYQAAVIDESGDSIGKVAHVYLDNRTERPSWVTVRTGFFGTHETLVPLRGAKLSDGDIHIPYRKAYVKDAPHFDAERRLTEDEEGSFYRYYDDGDEARDDPERDDRDEHRGHDQAPDLKDRQHDESRHEGWSATSTPTIAARRPTRCAKKRGFARRSASMRRPGSDMTRTTLTSRIRFPAAPPPAATRPGAMTHGTMRPGTGRNCAPEVWSVTSTPTRAAHRPTRCEKRSGSVRRPPPMRRLGSDMIRTALTSRIRLPAASPRAATRGAPVSTRSMKGSTGTPDRSA